MLLLRLLLPRLLLILPRRRLVVRVVVLLQLLLRLLLLILVVGGELVAGELVEDGIAARGLISAYCGYCGCFCRRCCYCRGGVGWGWWW